MKVLVVNGNKIEIDVFSIFSGKESIYYNGELVSQKKSILGGLHSFQVRENGTDAFYEIKVSMISAIQVKRNGELLFADHVKNPRGIQL